MKPDLKQELLQRLSAVLSDLQTDGIRDDKAMWLLGSLGSDLARDMQAETWTGAKANMSAKAYDRLLETFRIEGNAASTDGRGHHFYAIQALSLSLVAQHQADPDIQQGKQLLDDLIEQAVAYYRRTQPAAE